MTSTSVSRSKPLEDSPDSKEYFRYYSNDEPLDLPTDIYDWDTVYGFDHPKDSLPLK